MQGNQATSSAVPIDEVEETEAEVNDTGKESTAPILETKRTRKKTAKAAAPPDPPTTRKSRPSRANTLKAAANLLSQTSLNKPGAAQIPAQTTKKVKPKGKENSDVQWATIKGGDQHAGLIDNKQDTYRLKLTAVTLDGLQYKGTVLHTGKTITFRKADMTEDPGRNKISKAEREAAAKAVIARGQLKQAAAAAATARYFPGKTAGNNINTEQYRIPKKVPEKTATPANPINNNPLLLPGLTGGTPTLSGPRLQQYLQTAAAVTAGQDDELFGASEIDPDEETGEGLDEPADFDNPSSQHVNNTGQSSNNPPSITLTSDQFRELFQIQATRNTQVEPANTNNDAMADFLNNQQQFFQAMSTDNRAIIEAIMNKKSDTDIEKEAGKQKTIDTHETEIPAMIDDMATNLSEARFLPMSTNLKYSQSLVPIKAKPARTNYTFTEFGINVNKFTAVHNCHDRQNPSLQLKAFRHDNLARVDHKNKVQIDGKDLSVKDTDQNLNNKWEAILSYLNFHVISTQICPANTESLTLLAAVMNYCLGGYGDPTSGDLSELFVRWTLLRAECAGKEDPVSYRTIYETLKEIVQNRTDKVTSLLTAAANAKKQVNDLTKETHNNHHNNPRGGRGGTRGGRGGGRAGANTTFRKRTNNFNNFPPTSGAKRPRGIQLCRSYNMPGGCPRAPGAAVKCTVKSGELIHGCDFTQPSGVPCGQSHPRTGNH